MQNRQINIGWSQTDITPDRPIYVIGQLYSRISSYVHDPLTATCLVLENGDDQVTLISCDMPSVPVMHIPRILERLQIPGIDRTKVIFSAIHTGYHKPPDIWNTVIPLEVKIAHYKS